MIYLIWCFFYSIKSQQLFALFFHLGIIDDPVKNAEDAASETIRARQWDWYRSTFYTRQEPAAAIVVIQTRWHEDDLSGRLFPSQQAQALAAEVDRLNETIAKLAAEGQDAREIDNHKKSSSPIRGG